MMKWKIRQRSLMPVHWGVECMIWFIHIPNLAHAVSVVRKFISNLGWQLGMQSSGSLNTWGVL
jgi:hypothetical protein